MFEQFLQQKQKHGAGDKWNDGISLRSIQNHQQAFGSFY